MKCNKCGLHYCLKSGTSPVTVSCSVNLHDDDLFGLTIDGKDNLFGVLRKNFKKLTEAEIRMNRVVARESRSLDLTHFSDNCTKSIRRIVP